MFPSNCGELRGLKSQIFEVILLIVPDSLAQIQEGRCMQIHLKSAYAYLLSLGCPKLPRSLEVSFLAISKDWNFKGSLDDATCCPRVSRTAEGDMCTLSNV